MLPWYVYTNIKDTFNLDERLLTQSWQGTCCNGQYQAKELVNQLNHLLIHGNVLNEVVWDPPHLVLKDVFDGKCGNSKDFLMCLMERSSIFNQICGLGKKFVQAKMQSNVHHSICNFPLL